MVGGGRCYDGVGGGEGGPDVAGAGRVSIRLDGVGEVAEG